MRALETAEGPESAGFAHWVAPVSCTGCGGATGAIGRWRRPRSARSRPTRACSSSASTAWTPEAGCIHRRLRRRRRRRGIAPPAPTTSDAERGRRRRLQRLRRRARDGGALGAQRLQACPDRASHSSCAAWTASAARPAILDRVLVPATAVTGGPAPESAAYELAAARPLLERPVVAAVLAWLRGLRREPPRRARRCSALLLGPHDGAAATEAHARAELDVGLRRLGVPRGRARLGRRGGPPGMPG